MKNLLAAAALLCAGVAALAAQSAPAPKAAPAVGGAEPQVSRAEAAKQRAWLNQNCVACHSSRVKQPADDPVNLEFANVDDVIASAATWERVLRKLAVRAMPPQGGRHPSEPEYVAFTTWLSASLDRAWGGKGLTPGRFLVHRLNRTEYGNAIRDLLALDVNVDELLPSDGADFGFDNIASALKTSPLLLERYLTAAQRVSLLAVGDTAVPPGNTEYPISREFTQSGYIEGLPLGTRGGTVVKHVFPADGEYKLSGRLVRGVEEGYAGVEGNDLPHTFVITIDGAEVYSTQIGGLKDNEVQARDMNEARTIIDTRMAGKVRVMAGEHEVGYTWRDRPFERQDVWQPARRDSQEVHLITGLPRLKAVMVEGPYKVTGISATPSREKIFVCKPASAADESVCATKILTTLARRAYRRPATAGDVDAPMTFYKQARARGGDFDAGIRSGVARIIASPSFLYRIERDPATLRAGTAHSVSDVELASRLSFFLWSSIPDEKLLNAATAGTLRAPGGLDAQVRRMVSDERSDALVSNFAGQWLQLRNLESKVSPDLLMFPDFDDNTRRAFRRETELLFDYILRENRSVLELMNADYTFLNERLAKHYGVKGVYGERFRKVKLTDPNRFGLLGHGSILSLTAVATRTSPVYRGKYVLANFLDTPPIPPPPNVPTLEESNKAGAVKAKTVREQTELHRAQATCAGCHRVIDPPGFALEHFNSVGQWRDVDEIGRPIDSAGVLADGTKVDGPVAMRDAILKRPSVFATVLTTRLLTYALGRGLEPSDMPVVRRIVRKAALDDYRFATIITGIVESPLFQMRTRLEPSDTNTVASAREQ
jgi:mono/diheme cytochrome c family protein